MLIKHVLSQKQYKKNFKKDIYIHGNKGIKPTKNNNRNNYNKKYGKNYVKRFDKTEINIEKKDANITFYQKNKNGKSKSDETRNANNNGNSIKTFKLLTNEKYSKKEPISQLNFQTMKEKTLIPIFLYFSLF